MIVSSVVDAQRVQKYVLKVQLSGFETKKDSRTLKLILKNVYTVGYVKKYVR